MKTLQKKSAKEIFKNAVKGKNFCTPEILYFEHIINYGVTVVVSDKMNFDLSKNFNNKEQALNYIKSLR